MARRTLMRFEQLESRSMLTAALHVVAPNATGLAPVILPPSITPAHTTVLPSPPAGQLPAGLPALAGQAEELGVSAFASFQAHHPTVPIQIISQLVSSGAFQITLREMDTRGDFVTETINETRSGISVNMTSHDGAVTQIVSANQSLVGTQNATLIDTVLSGFSVSTIFETSINGVTTTRVFG